MPLNHSLAMWKVTALTHKPKWLIQRTRFLRLSRLPEEGACLLISFICYSYIWLKKKRLVPSHIPVIGSSFSFLIFFGSEIEILSFSALIALWISSISDVLEKGISSSFSFVSPSSPLLSSSSSSKSSS